MGFLKDTCIFIHKVNSGNKVINIARHCDNKGKRLFVTDVVLSELKPGSRLVGEENEKANEIYRTIEHSIFTVKCIDKIDVLNSKNYKKNFDSIRSRYYGHLRDANYIKDKLKSGELTEEDLKNKKFMYKDFGECSCIAVAMDHPEDFIIISDDIGRVFLKPKINLFEKFNKSHGIKVWDYQKWVSNTEYQEEG